MFDAAKQGNIAKIKELLNKGADVNAKKNDGRTALMQASFTFGIGFSDW
ncbi:MAG: ankyrin repeat domain-containing protein [Nitrospirae bacterium]|nr:ankyrin repeat domain-containing protein [Nitrospirota bacterium]